MRRRRFVATCGIVVAGLAGCLGGRSSPADPGTPTTNPASSPTASPRPDDAALSVSLDRLQPGVVSMTSPDSIGVRGAEGKQYLYLHLDVAAGESPERGTFSFRFDGEGHDPFEDRNRRLWRAREGDRYDPDSGSGWVLFELPETGDASDAALVWGNGEWHPDEGLRRRLAAPPPTLSLSWSVPESVPDGAEPTLGFEVTNEGERPGHFVAGLNRSGPSIAYAPIEAIVRPIPAGETETWDVTDSSTVRARESGQVGDGEPDMNYSLEWTDGSPRRHVRVTRAPRTTDSRG